MTEVITPEVVGAAVEPRQRSALDALVDVEPSALIASEDGAAMLAKVRAAIALLTVDDLPGMGDDVARLAALASAAGRAHLGAGAELDWAEAARVAERRLGQLLDEGREVGAVAKGKRSSGRSEPTLEELGIEHNMAADASAMAGLDDATWSALIARCREAGALHRGKVAATAREMLDELQHRTAQAEALRERASDERAGADREARAMRAKAKAIAAKIEKLADELARTPISVPDIEPDLTPLDFGDPDPDPDPPDLTTEAAGGGLPPVQGSTTTQLRAHEKLLQRLVGINHALDAIATEPLVERAETDAMLLNGIRSSVAHIVETAYVVARRYNDHLAEPHQLRSVK